MADANHYLVTLAPLSGGEELTFWVTGQSQGPAIVRAKKCMGSDCRVVQITPRFLAANTGPLRIASGS
jgi:hypothetical protein